MQNTPKHVRQSVGEAIQAARLRAGLTQVELAAKARISQTHLSRLESGRKAPSLGSLRRLARLLKLNLAALVAA